MAGLLRNKWEKHILESKKEKVHIIGKGLWNSVITHKDIQSWDHYSVFILFGVCMHITQHSCHYLFVEGRGQCWESANPFHYMGIQDQTQIDKVGPNYPLPIEQS